MIFEDKSLPSQSPLRQGCISDLLGTLTDIEPVSVDAANFALPDAEQKDIFVQKKHAAWQKGVEPRCDFQRRPRLIRRAGIWFHSLWQQSVMGRTLSDIKSDDSEIAHFAAEIAEFIAQVIGDDIAYSDGSWCIVTTPSRRHKERNFASLTSSRIADILGITYVNDCATCRSRHRVGAVFNPNNMPVQRNVILFDDIVTTGSTLASMSAMLRQHHKNIIIFAGINNAS